MLQNLEELRAFIQKNAPMFLTNDITLYSIIGKMVDYLNKLIVRSNELNALLLKLKLLTEEELKNLNTRVDNFITQINKEFDNFKEEINSDLSKFKKDVTDNYNTFTQEQLDRLDSIIRQLTDEFDRFKSSIVESYNNYIASIKEQLDTFIEEKENQYTTDKEAQEELFNSYYTNLQDTLNNQYNAFIDSINSDLDTFKETIQELLNTKNQEVQNALDLIDQNIESVIEQQITTYLHSDDFSNYIRSLYPLYVTLTYYGDTIPNLEETDGYVYDTTNNKLYLCEQSDVQMSISYKEIDMTSEMQNVLFTYKGYVYAITGGKLVDVRLGNE